MTASENKKIISHHRHHHAPFIHDLVLMNYLTYIWLSIVALGFILDQIYQYVHEQPSMILSSSFILIWHVWQLDKCILQTISLEDLRFAGNTSVQEEDAVKIVSVSLIDKQCGDDMYIEINDNQSVFKIGSTLYLTQHSLHKNVSCLRIQEFKIRRV